MIAFIENGIFKHVCANKETDKLKAKTLVRLGIEYVNLRVFKINDETSFMKMFSAKNECMTFVEPNILKLENILKAAYSETVLHTPLDDDALTHYTQAEIDLYTSEITILQAEIELETPPATPTVPTSPYLTGDKTLKSEQVDHPEERELCCQSTLTELDKATVFNG